MSASEGNADIAKASAFRIYDGVDAPPDGIDVPKWRC
jgi:hypothetical protein